MLLGREPPNAWNILSDKSAFIVPDGHLGPNLTTEVYGDEVTHGGPLGSLRMGAGLVGKIDHLKRERVGRERKKRGEREKEKKERKFQSGVMINSKTLSKMETKIQKP